MDSLLQDNISQDVSFAFSPLLTTGCQPGSVPLFALPGVYDGEIGIDNCIIKQTVGLDPLKDRKEILQKVNRNCSTNVDSALTDHRVYCAPKKTFELLWDAGACRDQNGFPLLSQDGRLVCPNMGYSSGSE